MYAQPDFLQQLVSNPQLRQMLGGTAPGNVQIGGPGGMPQPGPRAGMPLTTGMQPGFQVPPGQVSANSGLPPGGIPFEGGMPSLPKLPGMPPGGFPGGFNGMPQGNMPFIRDAMMQSVMGQLNKPNFGVPGLPPRGPPHPLLPPGPVRGGGFGSGRNSPYEHFVDAYRARSGNPSIFAR